MTAARLLWTRFFPNPGYYGWTIVAVGALCSMLSAPGQSFALSLYLEHMIRDVGISRVEISSLYALATLAGAVVLPLAGGLADRIPAQRYLTVVVLLLAAALAFLASVSSIGMLAVGFFLMRFLGQGAMGLGTITVAVRWFRRYRGRALAVVSLGFAFGELVFPGLILWLIDRFGWRGSLVFLAATYALVFAPLLWRFLRERTAEEAMDGEAVASIGGVAVPAGDVDFSVREALRTPVFWGMLLCVSIPPMLLTAVIFHQVAIFESHGWAIAAIPQAFAAYALASVATTYGIGVALERVPVRFGIALALALGAAGLAWMGWGPQVAWASLVYGGVLGLSAGTASAANSMVWPDYYGIQALGALKGIVNSVRNASTAVGPPVAALIFAATGSFLPAMAVFGTLAIVAGVASLFMLPPRAASPEQLVGDSGAAGVGNVPIAA